MTTTQIIAKEGWIGALVWLVAFVLAMLLDFDVCAFVLFVVLCAWLYAFRNPERIPQNIDEATFVSPVDGIVRDIRTQDGEIIIIIETRLFDVGVIRAPCDIVSGKRVRKSGLNLSFSRKAKVINTQMSFESLAEREFAMRFYPAFFASSNIFADSHLNLGERVGFMKMGVSEIYIPKGKKSMDILVNIGDRIYALDTPLGRFYEV